MKYIVFLSILLLSFSGCASKNYFEPKSVAGTANFSGSVVTSISSQTRDAATLSDGRVITKKAGLVKGITLSKGFKAINDSDDVVIASDIYGDVMLISKADGTVKNKLKLDTQILSATLDGTQLAMLDAKNSILLYDLSTSSLVYKEKLHSATALDTRVASPVFLNDIIVFPTLDGRLLIMSRVEKRVLRDIAISSSDIFNNVIFLKVCNDTLIGATRSKVISVSTSSIKNFSAGIKDIACDMDKVYLFTVDGKVILLTLSLDKINELALKNAIFSYAFVTDSKVYAVEKTGYLIEIEKDLSSYKVKKLDDEIESPVFASKNQLFIGDKYINLQ